MKYLKILPNAGFIKVRMFRNLSAGESDIKIY